MRAVPVAQLRRRCPTVAPCSLASRLFDPLRGRLRRPGHELRATPERSGGRRRRGAPLGARARGRRTKNKKYRALKRTDRGALWGCKAKPEVLVRACNDSTRNHSQNEADKCEIGLDR